MPDDSDYKSFFDLLARPDTWTADDRRVMEVWLRQQREELEGSNPNDTRRRAALSRIIEQVEAAVAQHDGYGYGWPRPDRGGSRRVAASPDDER